MLEHNRYSGTAEDAAVGFGKTTELTEQNRIVPSEDSEDGPVAEAWFVITAPPPSTSHPPPSLKNQSADFKQAHCEEARCWKKKHLKRPVYQEPGRTELLLHNATCANQLITASPAHSGDSATSSCKDVNKAHSGGWLH